MSAATSIPASATISGTYVNATVRQTEQDQYLTVTEYGISYIDFDADGSAITVNVNGVTPDGALLYRVDNSYSTGTPSDIDQDIALTGLVKAWEYSVIKIKANVSNFAFNNHVAAIAKLASEFSLQIDPAILFTTLHVRAGKNESQTVFS